MPKEEHPSEFPQGMDGWEKTTEGPGGTDSEVRARWRWAEPKVWTDRMLTALEEGVKGGRWHCLWDKVLKPENARSAYAKVSAKRGSAGVDHVTVERFGADLENNLTCLIRELRDGKYVPCPVRRVEIPKPGSRDKRPLGIPTVRDRVVQGMLKHVLEPIYERDFAEHSYGFRPGRGCKDALRQVQRLLLEGHHWVVDADIRGYFDSIPHEQMIRRLRTKVADGTVLGLVEAFLKQGILDGLKHWTPEQGTPQGAVLSPLLANVYLDPLDHQLAGNGYAMVRYADDFVVMCRSQAEAEQALEAIRAWMEAAGLTLHPEKTRIVDATQGGGFDFLGYHFERGLRWPRKKSLRKFQDAIRVRTRRCNGQGLDKLIALLNPLLRGWFEYFKHSHPPTFRMLDGWVRMRLRSILRKRRGGHGRGRGTDHWRWPNAFLARHGLFSLLDARALASQSARR
jgi:RNA-directed DNA polymerase